MRALIPALLPFALLAGCSGGGGHDEAKALIAAHCAACHIVPGVGAANGRVGPPLAGIGQRQVIAGFFPNSRPNLVRWIGHSQDMLPGNAMPNSGLTPRQAAAVADYLYTLDE
jgi:cytochrome c1